MLALFRTNQILSGVLYIPYILLLWHPVFIFPSELKSALQPGVLSLLLQQWLEGYRLLTIISIIVILWLQGMLVTFLVNNWRINKEVNLFPGLFYILIVSCLPDFLTLSPILLANLFLLLGLYNLFGVYKNNNSAGLIFNTGLFIGIAGMFYSPYLFFLLLGLIGIGLLRAGDLKESLMLIIGAFIPFFLAGAVCFWQDNLTWFIHIQFNDFLSLVERPARWDSSAIIKTAIFGVLILYAIVNIGNYTYKQSISAQKYISIFYWILFLAGCLLFFQKTLNIEYLAILSVPLGIFLSLSFTAFRNHLAAEIFHIILLVIIIMTHYLLG